MPHSREKHIPLPARRPIDRHDFQFNHRASGEPSDWNNSAGPEILPRIREAVFSGRFHEAEELCKKMQGPYTESYMPLADLRLEFPKSEHGNVSDYRRTLDLDNATVTVSYRIGDFVWTGMDYLGESGCGHMRFDNEPSDFGRGWPWFNAFCGDLDICGFRKPQSFFRDVVWGRSPLEIMVHRPLPPGRTEQMSRWGWPDELPSWTWPGEEGKAMEVMVYSSCDTVRLELNGKEIATRKLGEKDRFRTKFEVPYQPGELRVVWLDQGTTVSTKTLRNTGPAAKIRLVADRRILRADRNDLSYVSAEITDADGSLLADAALPVCFSVSGEGELAAVGSGSPNTPESFRGPLRTTWRGRALAIVRPKAGAGSIKLRAEAEGLSAGEILIQIQ